MEKALEGAPRGELRYFAELLLRREEEALGRLDAARDHFQAAVDLYPRAPSPHLALSRLARQSGDRQAALGALQRVTAVPASELGRADPWWRYYDSHVEDAGDLLRDLYADIQRGNP